MTLHYCLCFCDWEQKHQPNGVFFFFIIITLYRSNDFFSSCWTLLDCHDLDLLILSNTIQWAPPRLKKAQHEFKKSLFFCGKWSLHEPLFLRNVLTLPPSLAGKHSFWLILHRRCVYRRRPVCVCVPPIACTLTSVLPSTQPSPQKWLWCSGRVMAGEANESWRLGWSCRMRLIHNVNITDRKKWKSWWCCTDEFSFYLSGRPSSFGHKLTKSKKKWRLLSLFLWDFVCNCGLFTKAKKEKKNNSLSW